VLMSMAGLGFMSKVFKVPDPAGRTFKLWSILLKFVNYTDLKVETRWVFGDPLSSNRIRDLTRLSHLSLLTSHKTFSSFPPFLFYYYSRVTRRPGLKIVFGATIKTF